jgi:Galactocerebrosidase, C-terminal lectin domain
VLTRRRAVLRGLAAPLLPATPTTGWAAEALVVDLKGLPPGPLPDSFTTARTGQGAPSTWLVQEDTSVPAGRVITQTSNDKTDYRFPLAIYQPFSGADVEVTVRFKAVGGSIDRAGGVVVRLIHANNYYVLRANALEDNVNFYHVVQGVRRQIKGAAAKVSSGQWHSLTLKAEGDQFIATFDSKPILAAKDHTFPGAGKVALWTKADSVTSFDAFTIHP